MLSAYTIKKCKDMQTKVNIALRLAGMHGSHIIILVIRKQEYDWNSD